VSAAARAAGGRCFARAAPRAASVSRSSAAPLRGRQARFGLGAQLRITLRRDFERLLRQGVRRNVSGYTFYVGQRQEGPARLGILISRKHSPKAVRRNAIKRSVREAFRLEQERLGAFDLLVRPPYGAAPGREMIASLRQLLVKIGT
jgi:ribonuclease P protein component